ncbi:hypothetical protein [Chryseobacterium sp. R2ACT005]|uniref:hypothetical protein n=1 Tax=Chryseobacterium sp. R2ACT005 TaxID=3416668 RepID=UPI003CE996EF
MNLKLYVFIVFLIPGIIFSQRKPNDTLRCSDLMEDPIINKIVYAYQNKPEKPKKIVNSERTAFCGTELMKEFEEETCITTRMILNDYPFLINEIKKLVNHYPNYIRSDIFWIDRKKERNDKSLRVYREETLKKWESKGNHSYFSILIISDKTNNNHEATTLTIRFPGKTITKHYRLLLKDQ